MQTQKYFNTSGPNILAEHYTLLREELVKEGIKLVNQKRYFTIWAPRQSGKSTYFRLLSTKLEKEGYKVCYVNFENYTIFPIETFTNTLIQELHNFWKKDFSGKNLAEIFQSIQQIKEEKYVLIIDEVEGINPSYLNIFLHSIRSAYHTREFHSLKSVILVGVANLTEVIEDNASPFNIVDSFSLPYFSKEELFELYAQHEIATGQLFEEKVKQKIYDITAGQPGLVNGFALRLVSQNKDKKVITYSDYLSVEHWYLYESLDKNVANIVKKAKKHQAFIEKLLFTEKEVFFNIYDARIRYFFVNGLITKDKNGNVSFAVLLYKKCLLSYFYPILNGESEIIQANINVSDYFSEKEGLKLDKIIRGYQEYAKKRGFRYFIQRDAEGNPLGLLEAALMYSFETYIQSYLQILKGKSYVEPHVALGRSDLILNVAGYEAVIEGKIYNNITQFTDGKSQLAYYIKSLGLTKGIYLVFVSSIVTHPLVKEEVESFDGVELSTYLVRYDLEKDFSEPRKRKYKKKAEQ